MLALCAAKNSTEDGLWAAALIFTGNF